MTQDRIEKFEKRQLELKQMSDEDLKAHFWDLCNQVVEPIVQLARTHTSPSIERSVLLRMGIDSISAHAVVALVMEAGLLSKGAGNVVYRVAQKFETSIPAAADLLLTQDIDLNELFSTTQNQAGQS